MEEFLCVEQSGKCFNEHDLMTCFCKNRINEHDLMTCTFSQYNEDGMETGPRMNSLYVVRELTVKGFLVTSYYDRYDESMRNLSIWVKEGKIKALETMVKGFENIPQALMRIFSGDKIGKIVVDCCE